MMKKAFKIFNYNILSVSLFLLISIATLFIPPIIGMADNGEFYNIISENDLYYLSNNEDEIYFGYFNKDYGIFKYNNEIEKNLISTQSIFIRIAVFIDKLITKDYIFDIRILGFIYMIISSFGIYFLTKALTKEIFNTKYKILMILFINIIFADTAYLSYYNSFYEEGTSMSCFLFSMGILLYMCKYNKFNIYNMSLFGVFIYLLMGVKENLLLIGVLSSLLVLKIMLVYKNRSIKVISGILIALFIGNYIYYNFKNDQINYSNKYNSMTRGVLLDEENPDKVLSNFNIYNQYSILRNENFFEDIPMINPYNKRLIDNFYNKYSYIEIVRFYIRNPKKFIKMGDIISNNLYSIRPNYIGNYEKIIGKPYGEKSYFFTIWSSLKEKFIPNGFGISLIYIFLFVAYFIKEYINGIKAEDKSKKFFQYVSIYILSIGLVQILISTIKSGDVDLISNLFIYNLIFDLVILIIISGFLKKYSSKGCEK